MARAKYKRHQARIYEIDVDAIARIVRTAPKPKKQRDMHMGIGLLVAAIDRKGFSKPNRRRDKALLEVEQTLERFKADFPRGVKAARELLYFIERWLGRYPRTRR